MRWLLVSALSAVACISPSYSYQEVIPVPGNGERNRARSYVTQERYDRLKAQVGQRFPDLPAERLNGLFLRWRVAAPPADGASIVVGIQYGDPHFAAEPDVQECAELIRRDLSATIR